MQTLIGQGYLNLKNILMHVLSSLHQMCGITIPWLFGQHKQDNEVDLRHICLPSHTHHELIELYNNKYYVFGLLS